jgi:MATE family multidrug resistance protein
MTHFTSTRLSIASSLTIRGFSNLNSIKTASLLQARSIKLPKDGFAAFQARLLTQNSVRWTATSTRSQTTTINDDDYEREAEASKISLKLVVREMKRILMLGSPVSGAYALSMASQFVAIGFLGHVGAKELAAASLAVMYTNVCGFSIIVGLSTAMDTLGSQAYTGSNDKHVLGRIVQRGLVVMLLLTIPIAALFWNAEKILLAFSQDPGIAKMSGSYVRKVMPTLFPIVVSEAVKRFLQSQGIMVAGTYTALLSLLLTFPLCSLLVGKRFPDWSMGFDGAPIVSCIVTYANMFLLLVYARWGRSGQAWQHWGGWTRQAFTKRGIVAFLSLGLPAIIAISSEWWAWEITALECGWIGETALATQSILMNLTTLPYTIPLGIAVALSNRIGSLVGAQLTSSARLAAVSGLCLASGMGMFNMIVLYAFRDSFSRLLTNDESVIEQVKKVLPLAAAFQVFDGLACVAGGCIRGVGHQRYAAIANLLGFYVIGIPIGYYLAFNRNEEISGVWKGLSLGLIIMSMMQVAFVLRLSWPAEAQRALARAAMSAAKKS